MKPTIGREEYRGVEVKNLLEGIIASTQRDERIEAADSPT